jgi:thiol-disulfide isomerase/thioredoxin
MLVLAAMCLVMTAASAFPEEVNVGDKPSAMGADAKYINCDEFDLVKLRSKVVVMQFAHTKLDPCKEQVAKLKELVTKYQEKGLRLVCVFEEPKEAVQSFVDANSIEYPVVANVLDLRKRWGVSKFPTSLVLDVTGKVAWKGFFADRADIEIAALLKKVSDRPWLPPEYAEITAALDAENWPDARAGLVAALAKEGVIEDDKGRLQKVLGWLDELSEKAYDEASKLRAKGNYLEVYEGFIAMAKAHAGSDAAEKAQAAADALMADKKTKREIEGWRFFAEQFEAAKEIEMKDRKKAIALLKKVVSRYRGSQAADKADYWIERLSE